MNARLILAAVLAAAGVASVQLVIDGPSGKAPETADAAPSVAPVPPVIVAAADPAPTQIPSDKAFVEPIQVAAEETETNVVALLRGAASGAPKPVAPRPSCVEGESASEQILRLSSRVQADVSTGDLMPWDAQEISNSLRAASQMLGRRELDSACTTLAQAERRFPAR